MRRLLDGLYHFSSFVAGALVVFIFLVILAQIVGRQLGLVVPSANELSGFAMAGAVFFALAPTLRAGVHIRVGVLVRLLKGRTRLALELLVGGLALVASSYATYHLGRLVLDSYRFGDLAPGILPLPIWIPQSLVAAGMAIFTVALADTLVSLLRGELPAYLAEAKERSEP
jgi:TRAP-type C4-dicarboxylate transport system permease small subunit